MMKDKVLFVCSHNSARSPMAQGLMQTMCGDQFEVWSGGITAGRLNPLAVAVMNEVGIDISQHKPVAVFDLFKRGITFQYVISLCDGTAGERCPTVPGFSKRMEWSFEDPALISDALPVDARLGKMRAVRDEIQDALAQFCRGVCPA